MCGIAGRLGPRPLGTYVTEQVSVALAHRGPDGFENSRIAVGNLSLDLFFSRLSIIDLSPRSMQPFSFDDSVLIFNGEIYNYREIREDLVESGHQFRTSGDAEVLVHALREWGTGCLDRLEGMWAFAWYDNRDQKLWLSRDRFGEKPLYVYRLQDELVFASEPAAIAAIVGRKLNTNHTQVLRYLVNGYKSLFKHSETFFENVTALEPGSWISVDCKLQTRIGKYWNLEHRPSPDMSYEDAVSGVRVRLENSLRLRLRADVPIAFCLSSGIDSNSLAFLAKQLCDERVATYTIQTNDARYDESEAVSRVVQAANFDHTFIRVSQSDNLKHLRNLINRRQMPIATISYFIQALMLEAMSERGVKVSISGTAADELFTGYYDHHHFYLSSIFEDSRLFEESLSNWKRYVSAEVRNPYLKDPFRFVENPGFREHIYLNAKEFGALLVLPWEEQFIEKDFTSDVLRNRMLNELFAECVPVILMEDDFNAMSVSVENRSPFLDRQLAEFAFKIPTPYLIRDGYSKAVLRDAMRGVIPDWVRTNHKKIGFNANIRDLFNFDSPALKDELMSNSTLFNYIKRDAVERLIHQRVLKNSESKFFFNILCTAMFLDSLIA